MTLQREDLEAAGFTYLEAKAWVLIGEAATAYLNVTEREPGHPMERQEICTAFHDIQARLAMRPTLRAIGIEYQREDPQPDPSPASG